jgi:two-component system sensor histidine kinase YesM
VTDQPIPLQTEIDLVTTYLEIQKMRFGDRFNFEVNVYCNIDQYHVFPLLLQPLVENSVIHGVADTEESFIQVIILENNTHLIIQVIDNGVGISDLTLSELTKELNEMGERLNVTNGIGLHNVNKRIKLYYGNEYGISMNSRLGYGTTVTLSIPIQKGAPEDAKGINR